MQPPPASDRSSHNPALVIAAFAAVYIVWGSTYLAIRFAVAELPPFITAATRFLIAGAILFAWGRIQGEPLPTPVERRSAAVGGLLLLLGGNGAVVWAEQFVPSGIAALIVATLPLWMVLLEWARPGGSKPGLGVFVGLALGLAGIGLLLDPGDTGGGVDVVGAVVLCFGSVSWAAGSIYMRNVPMPRSAFMSNGIQMLAGGTGLMILGSAVGEFGNLELAAASAKALLSVAYLIVFGSLIGFTAYTYILRVSTPARVSTYAYVNPVVAVFLGWALAGETITIRTLAAAGVILLSVAIITLSSGSRRRSRA